MPFLLLRGLAREKRHWGDFPNRLAARLGDVVITLDLPGFGSESRRPSPTSIAGIVDDLRERFLRERPTTSAPWSLLGISLGGMVTLDWCARYPDDFARAVVVNTSSAVSWPFERFRPANYPRILSAVFAKNNLDRERAILSFTVNRADLDKEAIAQQWAVWADETRAGHGGFVRQLFGASRWRLPANLSVPLLVLASRADRLVSSSCSAQIAKRLGAPIVQHDSGGHDLSLDAPDWLTDQVAAFVESAKVAP